MMKQLLFSYNCVIIFVQKCYFRYLVISKQFLGSKLLSLYGYWKVSRKDECVYIGCQIAISWGTITC